MSALLAGDDSILAILREQFAVATLEGREWTGVGFFTNFAVPATTPRVERPRHFDIEDVDAKIAATRCGFILFVRDGALSWLEGFTYGDDEWPAEAEPVEWHYLTPIARGPGVVWLPATERDLTGLRREWERR
jgi:hypothetical protein